MKGILYESILLNRRWFLIAGIVGILGTAASVVMMAIPDFSGGAGMIFILSEVIAVVLCFEWIGRHFEKNLKCRFVDLTLAGGISKNQFVMSLMVENLISMAIGLVICAAMNGVMLLADNIIDKDITTMSDFYIKAAVALSMFIGIVDFVGNPLIIKFKSAEKAGLTLGIFIMFVIGLPIMMIYREERGNDVAFLMEDINNFADAWYFFPVIVGAAAVIYAIVYVVTLYRVKRGDVC